MSDLQSFNNKWLIGSGEMGHRIAAFDWSRHPLGAIEFWPQSLKTIIHTMLNSRYSMWMGWGPEFYFFCNDAYLPALGIKERWALGASARKVWAEIWPDIGPRAESVVRTGQAAWDDSQLLFLERSGSVEESYHAFSYSPIPDDFGAVGGFLCIVTEETERVLARRRFELLRKLGTELATISREDELFNVLRRRLNDCSKELPFVLLYLFNPEGKRADLVSAHGVQPGANVAPASIAIGSNETIWPAQQIFTGGAMAMVDNLAAQLDHVPSGPWGAGPRQAVVLPIGRQGQEKPAGFLVAGINPFKSLDAEYQGFISLLAGEIAAALSNVRAAVEERRRNEAQKIAAAALKDSEERFARFMRHLPGMAWIKDSDGRYIFASDSALKAFDTTPERLYGKTDEDIFPQTIAALFRENDRMALGSEAGVQTVEQLKHHDGTLHHSIVHKFPIPGPSDKPTLIGGIAIDITERKRAEDARRQSEERLRMATQTGRVGVWDWDIQHNRISWSDSLYAIHGIDAKDFDGTVEGFAALVHPDDRQKFAMAIQRALDGQATYELEFRILRPNGEVGWIFTNATTIRDRGRPVRMIGATVDISERKRVETALRDSEDRIQQLVSLMPAAIYTCDEAGRITYYNKRAVELWGREPELASTAEKFTGSYRLRRPDGALLAPDQSPMAAAIRDGRSLHNTEVEVERPDGSRIVISANIEPLRDHQGRRSGAIGVFQDVSERKAAERELHRQTEHIQLLSETVAQLLRATDPDSVIRNLFSEVAGHVGADTYLHFMVNDAGDGLELHSCAGIPDAIQESIARLDFGDTLFGTVDQHPIVTNDIQDSDDEKAAPVRKLGIQTYACNPLMVGERLLGTLSFASHARKSFDTDEIELLHIISQYAAIALDRLRAATALGKSEEQLRRQAQELEQQLIATGRLVSLGEITASMAHEFNNPLGIILGFVEDLLLSTHPADANYRPLQIVDEEAKRCQRIIQDLMDYTRPRAVSLTSISLNSVIAKTLTLVETRLYKQKIKLQTTVEANLPTVYADYQQLEQVLLNLYLNAIDAMPHGGTLTVSAQVCRDKEELAVCVAVSDTGFGIETELLTKIFQPFYTAKKTRGMGLGLPICQRIVRNHGGHIEVESIPGRGTTFRVYLPLIETNHTERTRLR